jgi:hypothetical protein
VTTVDGSVLCGKGAELTPQGLTMTTVGGQRITLERTSLAMVRFPVAGEPVRMERVLVWKGAASAADAKGVAETITTKLGLDCDVNTGDRVDDRFKEQLHEASALLILESNVNVNGGNNGDFQELAAALKEEAGKFLNGGGRIIFMGGWGANLISQAGMMSVYMNSSWGGSDLRIKLTKEGWRLKVEDKDSFSVNGQCFGYALQGEANGVVVWATANVNGNQEFDMIMARPVGEGWVILMGLPDLRNNETGQALLRRAVTFE